MPCVSVIINVRNGASTLRDAIASLRAQSFTDWEAIIWDDASTDESARVVGEFTDSRIRYYLSAEDVPLGRARKLAMREARGVWVSFLDQDDLWLPDKLEKQLRLASDDPSAGMIYGRTVAFTPGGRVRDYDHRHEYQPLPEGDIFERLFVDSCFIAQSSVCIRSALLREIEEIPEAIQVTPDYYLYLELAHRAPVRAVQSVVTRYRLHPGSMSRRTGRRMHEEALWLLDRWKDRIDPELLAHRRRVHYTLVSLTYIFHRKTAWYGLRTLVERGSPAFLFSRPFARGFRLIRRRIQTPFWKRPETMCPTGGCAG